MILRVSVTVMPANMPEHVRLVTVYDYPEIREA